MNKSSLKLSNLDKRKIFLLEFTKELIKNSEKTFQPEFMTKEVSEMMPETREKIKLVEPEPYKKIKPVSEKFPKEFPKFPKLPQKFPLKPVIRKRPLVKKGFPVKKRFRELPQQIPKRIFKPRPPRNYILRVPQQELPPQFQYLKPIPGEKQVDLGKLNPLLKDHAVRNIECDGSGKRVVVTGTMGMRATNIILTKEEIDDVIEKFSEASKIPASPGVFRVVIGRLILYAIISEVVGTRFMIKKMYVPPKTPVFGNYPK